MSTGSALCRLALGRPRTTMAKSPASTCWDHDLWATVSSKFHELLQQTPPKTEEELAGGGVPKSMTTVMKTLASKSEARGIIMNLTYTDPRVCSVPGDVMTMAKAEKAAKFYFWDSSSDAPRAPAMWPRGRNIPIAILGLVAPDKGQFRRYGLDHVVVAFWWAFGRALERLAADKTSENYNRAHAFELLCLNAVFDFKSFSSEEEIMKDTFQFIEDTEELREHSGFSGFRKLLLVQWAFDLLKKKGGKTPLHQEIAQFLKSQLRWHDEKQAPSEVVVRDLLLLTRTILKSDRAMRAIQEAEVLWGRNTLFDEYSKLTAIVNKSRGAEDLAFIVESLVSTMKQTTPPGSNPDVVSRATLSGRHGDIAVAQLSRDVLSWLLKQKPESWAKHNLLLDKFLSPAGFDELFPTTPEKSISNVLFAAPASLKAAVGLARDIHQKNTVSLPRWQRVCWQPPRATAWTLKSTSWRLPFRPNGRLARKQSRRNQPMARPRPTMTRPGI